MKTLLHIGIVAGVVSLAAGCGDPKTAAPPPAKTTASQGATAQGPTCNSAEDCATRAASMGVAGLPLHIRACDLGRGESCYVVALIRDESGAVVPGASKSPAEATHFYALGCEQGYADACGPASLRLRRGVGAPPNPDRATLMDKRAVQDFTAACDAGDAEGCRSVGLLYAMGRGVEKDTAAAERFGDRAQAGFRAGCDKQVASACRQFASCFHLGGCGDVAADVERAIALYGLACKGGDAAACRLQTMVSPR